MEFIIPQFEQIVRRPILPLLPQLSTNGGRVGNPELRAACGRGQGPFNSDMAVLSYCMSYMYMHHDALVSVIGLPQHSHMILQEQPLLIIDFGCGPGTVGIALCNYLRHHQKTHRSIFYVGIDISPYMLMLAQQFMGAAQENYCAFFQNSSEASAWVSDSEVSKFPQYLVAASYLCSQSAMKDDTAVEMASLLRSLIDAMPLAEGFLISTNIDTRRAYSMPDYYPVFERECLRQGICLPQSAGSLSTGSIRKPKLYRPNEFFRDSADEGNKVCYVVGKIANRPANAAPTSR